MHTVRGQWFRARACAQGGCFTDSGRSDISVYRYNESSSLLLSWTRCYALTDQCIIKLVSPQNALLERIDAQHEVLNQTGLLSARLGKKLQVGGGGMIRQVSAPVAVPDGLPCRHMLLVPVLGITSLLEAHSGR